MTGPSVLCSVLILIICVALVQGEFSCFRKFKKKRQTCGGLTKKKGVDTAEKCCSWKGQGFALQTLDKIGRNKYRCVSCTEWERQKNEPSSVTTPATSYSKPDFVCFRKFKKRRGHCGGPKKKPSLSTPESCCQKNTYGGFSLIGLDKKGKNKYACRSCLDWKAQMTTAVPETTTTQGQEEWGEWGECQTTCGVGTKVRYSKCKACGRAYVPKLEHHPCIINYYCPVNGNWGEWESWQACSVSCNGGLRMRRRKCDSPAPVHGGIDCDGSAEEMESCNEKQCDVDGSWGGWSRFGLCSQTCGRGTMTRTRDCNRPAPSGGGQQCPGPSTNTRRCEHRKCPVHGGWSNWGAFSACGVTCGTSTITRTRVCNRPVPLFDGRACEGSDTETNVCSPGVPCPIHGGWSEWTSYGSCRSRQPCSHGHRLRSRVCNNPRPEHRGRLCMGKSVERESCFDQDTCPVDGGYCEFGEWSACSATCLGFSSTQTRFRPCTCPSPRNGGKHCLGDYLETRTCQGKEVCNAVSVSVDN